LKRIAFELKVKFVANAKSHLNNQIQQPEKYIHSSNLEEKLSFVTSMAPPPSFVYETPQLNVIGSGLNRYDAIRSTISSNESSTLFSF
jgi:hypothetical protein